MITVGVLTISDKGARGEREDKSGLGIRKLVKKLPARVDAYEVIPDERNIIANRLIDYVDNRKLDLIVTTGGTGVAPRDVTPDATLSIIEKEVPGMAEAMRLEGLKKTSHAMISRAVVGIRKSSLIVNLPGSPKAVSENLNAILASLPHAIAKIKGDNTECGPRQGMEGKRVMPEGKSKKNIREIFESAVAAVRPKKVVSRNVQLMDSLSGVKLLIGGTEYDLSEYHRIHVVGAGKAASSMALSMEGILGERISGGTVTVKYGHLEELDIVHINEAGHPIPDEAGIKGTRDILELVKGLTSHDLVVCLISGGGSALMPLPCEGISLGEKQDTTRLLLECGATINEINAIRKHISQIKGGKLAGYVYPATLVSLILSDVIGDRLDVIASGPTVPDESTFEDCLRIIERYGIEKEIPKSVLTHLTDGSKGIVEETPKPGDEIFSKTKNFVIGSNLLAINEARIQSERMGYNTLILSTSIEGETKDVAKVHAAIAREVLNSGNPLKRPACIISGGETTVTIQGKGLGGRNQEFVLAAAMEIDGLEGVTILSGGTDGTDGPTDAAGAIADAHTIERAKKAKMDPYLYLRNNDSYHFFQKLDDLLLTGPTNTNVMDLRLMIVE